MHYLEVLNIIIYLMRGENNIEDLSTHLLIIYYFLLVFVPYLDSYD